MSGCDGCTELALVVDSITPLLQAWVFAPRWRGAMADGRGATVRLS